ncbi:MAG: acyl-CoA thioesterase/BAAT N-terminal domain-containing protein [Sulfurovum sp.]|nr:acyl-CoA thioesterase/BAAT N-terminal domain-containing protein [Sulfurovum sp.]MCB4773352.1 acyl-CoA thioesterase/BAAT N-terminal domain-containing protein [Sulfurovum sp.]MCB4779519.1 acyl-CoA thioesterase/BAAT N-terminal domain-containing protein [Sulfurovum sp.]MCB4781023.1 acyl-CoA thioesterase/BAAT N-terminal domain-containing protein [Sulfurovum sp.]MCB4784333.1 acyl-CoA thioesterase/BAAT N-terminal domain-containing protein [Sulfurovum sp.]
MKEQIIITPNSVLYGEKVSIELKGFLANQELTIHTKMKDKQEQTWSAKATFVTNENGGLNLTKDAPISGSYSGIEPMGLFVYMKNEESQQNLAFWEKGVESTIVQFSVTINKQEVATNSVERYLLKPNVLQEEVIANGLNGRLFLPHKEANQKVILCLSGSDGGLPNEMAGCFASHGFASLSLAYFSHGELPKTLSEIPLEYFEKAFDFLEKHPHTDAKNISIVGGSRGAELALLLASKYSQINSVVAYAPSHVLWSGLGDYKQIKRSSWSYESKELPFVQVKMPILSLLKYFFSKKPIEFTSSFLYSLEKGFKEEAVISVENIKGDILLISGEDDQMWCSTLMANKIINRLKKHNFKYHYEHLQYKNAGHFITIPYNPSTGKTIEHPQDKKLYQLGGTTVGDLHASKESWLRVLEFLKK